MNTPIADFVRENGVGLTVDSLSELEKRIAAVSAEDYAAIADNAKRIGRQLREGFYTTKAIQGAIGVF